MKCKFIQLILAANLKCIEHTNTAKIKNIFEFQTVGPPTEKASWPEPTAWDGQTW